MKAKIRKTRDGRWFVNLEGEPVTAVFDSHDEAVMAAYSKGADDLSVYYSPGVMRGFGRESVENFIIHGELR